MLWLLFIARKSDITFLNMAEVFLLLYNILFVGKWSTISWLWLCSANVSNLLIYYLKRYILSFDS